VRWQGGSRAVLHIRILKGHLQERKDEIARRVTETISEVAKLAKEAV